MKPLFTYFLLLLVLTKSSFAQTTPAVGNSYTTQNTSILVYPFDPAVGKPDKKIHFILGTNSKFNINQILDSGYVIRVWQFKETLDLNKKNSGSNATGTSITNIDHVYVSETQEKVVKSLFYKFISYSATMKSRLRKSTALRDTLLRKQTACQNAFNTDSSNTLVFKKNFTTSNRRLLESRDDFDAEILKKITLPKNEQPSNIVSLSQLKANLDVKFSLFEKDNAVVYTVVPNYDTINFKDLKTSISSLRRARRILDSIALELKTVNLLANQTTLAVLIDTLLSRKSNLVSKSDSLINSIQLAAKAKQEVNKISEQIINQSKQITKDQNSLAAYDNYLSYDPTDNISPETAAQRLLDQINGNRDQNSNDGTKYNYRIFKPEVNTEMDSAWYNSKTPAALFDTLAYVDSWGNKMDFFVPLKSFGSCAQYYPSTNNFTWGFLSVPLKIRVAPYSFDQNVNFGLTFGWKWQRAASIPESNNVLFGVSVGSVNLTSPPNATGNTSVGATTTSCVSFSFGYMFQYDKFQVGGFLGWDIAGGSNRSEFVNAKTPWFGIAIGLSLFGENKTTASTQNQ